jgi:NADH-quinone oxidoreductase subunit L
VRGALLIARILAWFDGTIIDGIVNGSARVTTLLSRVNGLFDNYVVDWLVNLLANETFALGTRLRRIQTGSINAYLYVIVGTVTVVLIARLM